MVDRRIHCKFGAGGRCLASGVISKQIFSPRLVVLGKPEGPLTFRHLGEKFVHSWCQVKSIIALLGGNKAICRGGGPRAQGLVRAGVVPTTPRSLEGVRREMGHLSVVLCRPAHRATSRQEVSRGIWGVPPHPVSGRPSCGLTQSSVSPRPWF